MVARYKMVCATLLVATACNDRPPNQPPEVPPRPSDGSVTLLQRDAGSRDAGPGPGIDTPAPSEERDIGELAGVWHGQTMTKEYGVVSAMVSVMADGWVLATINAQGAPLSERLRIESWTGDHLRVRRQNGADEPVYEVDGRLSGDVLHLRLPIVGDVDLKRARPTKSSPPTEP